MRTGRIEAKQFRGNLLRRYINEEIRQKIIRDFTGNIYDNGSSGSNAGDGSRKPE